MIAIAKRLHRLVPWSRSRYPLGARPTPASRLLNENRERHVGILVLKSLTGVRGCAIAELKIMGGGKYKVREPGRPPSNQTENAFDGFRLLADTRLALVIGEPAQATGIRLCPFVIADLVFDFRAVKPNVGPTR
jgi:hypothetical protein